MGLGLSTKEPQHHMFLCTYLSKESANCQAAGIVALVRLAMPWSLEPTNHVACGDVDGLESGRSRRAWVREKAAFAIQLCALHMSQ